MRTELTPQQIDSYREQCSRRLRTTSHPKTAKMGIWIRLLREILAHNIDCMQVSASTRLYFTQ
jgi:hypothetical protein